jgi:hypothetical protein
MNTDVLRAVTRVKRVQGHAFAATVEFDSRLDTDGTEPDSGAYTRVPIRPRPSPRSGAVALLEPDDES